MQVKVKPVTANNGQAFRYYVNVLTSVAHTRRTCSALGSGTAGSNIVRDANPDADACGKCVPDKCKA